MKLDKWKSKMIGFGCDRTNANFAQGGLRGLLTCEMPWVFVFWCLSHRLELSVKDALKPTFFATVEELLLRLYYIYEKSSKKCHELEGIVSELKACLEPTEMPSKGGTRPLRACGTRFVVHKVAALERMIDRFGAYISHLTAMTKTKRSLNKLATVQFEELPFVKKVLGRIQEEEDGSYIYQGIVLKCRDRALAYSLH